ncbi:MAG: hypothetical protein ACLUVA_09305 [Faecalibacterium sp.]
MTRETTIPEGFHRHREYEQGKVSPKEQAYGFCSIPKVASTATSFRFLLAETIDIVDQKQQKQLIPANCQFHTSSQQEILYSAPMVG